LADGIFGVDDTIMGGIECYWWKFWRRLRALTEQLPRPVALAGGFEVPTGGSALRGAHCPHAEQRGNMRQGRAHSMFAHIILFVHVHARARNTERRYLFVSAPRSLRPLWSDLPGPHFSPGRSDRADVMCISCI
jgi:hypothetical protein